MDHIKDDKQLYKRKKYREYVNETGRNLHSKLSSGLGKSVGISDMLDEVFEKVITVEYMTDMYSRIIAIARAK